MFFRAVRGTTRSMTASMSHCPTWQLFVIRGRTLVETGKSVARPNKPELDWLISSSDLVSDDEAKDDVHLPLRSSLSIVLQRDLQVHSRFQVT